MKILIVEDEAKTAAYLRQGLEEGGFVADVAADGGDGLHLALCGAYDLVILDVMLPGRDGWSVLTGLREAGKQTPVVFLTARDAVEDRVRGLELGADDYLVKPFAFSELLARVRSVLRRGQARQPDLLRVGDKQKSPAAIPGAQIAWSRPYEKSEYWAVAYSKQWDNPRPDAEVRGIDVVYPGKKRGVPALLAVTAATKRK